MRVRVKKSQPPQMEAKKLLPFNWGGGGELEKSKCIDILVFCNEMYDF